MVRRLTVPLIVMAFLAIGFATVNTFAAPPAKAEQAKLECFNYWPDGVYLGARFKLVPAGATPEVRAAIAHAAKVEIATEHGRADLLERLMFESTRMVDKATFEAEMGFTPDSLVAASGIGLSTAPTVSSMVTPVEELNYSTERMRRPPRRGGGGPCTCSSLVCSADVCGKYYCSGVCGGCNLCG